MRQLSFHYQMNFKILFYFLIVSLSVNAQKNFQWKGQIKSGKEPVPFATVVVSPTLKIYDADENGAIEMDLNESDSISFQCLSYRSVKFSAAQLKSLSEVQLQAVAFQLAEVKVKNALKREWWGGQKGSKRGWTFAPGMQAAFQIQNPDKQVGKIKKVRYYIDNFAFDGGYRVPFRVKLYEVSTSGAPGRELLPEVVVVQSNKRKWFEVDISQYELQLPENGFFVGFQMLPTDVYEYKKKTVSVKYANGKTKQETSLVKISIGTNKEFEGCFSWQNFKDKWIRIDEFKAVKPEYEDLYKNVNFSMSAEIEY